MNCSTGANIPQFSKNGIRVHVKFHQTEVCTQQACQLSHQGRDLDCVFRASSSCATACTTDCCTTVLTSSQRRGPNSCMCASTRRDKADGNFFSSATSRRCITRITNSSCISLVSVGSSKADVGAV